MNVGFAAWLAACAPGNITAPPGDRPVLQEGDDDSAGDAPTAGDTSAGDATPVGGDQVAGDPLVAASALTWFGPVSGPLGAPSSQFTVGVDGVLTMTVQVTPADAPAGGTFTPATLALTPSQASQTFTYTPASLGQKTLTLANDAALTNPSPRSFVASASGLPGWVAALPLWQWYAIPNTKLSSVDPDPRRLGVMGPSAKIAAWNGATLKRSGSVYILGAAGGHGDYAGNEVDALALNTETPLWVELRAASDNTDIINATQFYLDLRPSSTHTYSATHFIDSQDRMVVFASPGVSGPFPEPPGDFPYVGDSRSYVFNVTRGDWEHPEHLAQFPGSGDFTASLCAKHPVTEDVYYSRNYGDGWWRWNAATNTWTALGGWSRNPWYVVAAIDPTRARMLVVGGYGGTAPPEVYDLNGASIAATFGGLGATALTVGGHPGVVYDEALDRYLVLANDDTATKLLAVEADDWTVSLIATTGLTPAARQNGIHNSVQYVPELRGIVFANRWDGDVYFLRTAP